MTPEAHERAVLLWAQGMESPAIAAELGIKRVSTLANHMHRHRADFPKRNLRYTKEGLREVHKKIHALLLTRGEMKYGDMKAALGVDKYQLRRILALPFEANQLAYSPASKSTRLIIIPAEKFSELDPDAPAAAPCPPKAVAVKPSAPPRPKIDRKAQIRAAIARKEARFHARYGRQTEASAHIRRANIAEHGQTA